jgi:colanic acid/amylovoran biosynthesis glycosyltransferase
MVLGYLIPEFPGQTHIWMWREICALRDAGVKVRLISTRRPPESACRHDFAGAGRRETHYVYPPSVVATARRSLRLLRAASYVAGCSDSSVRGKLRVAAMIPCAADLLQWSIANDITHIHAHSCADAAHIVAMTHAMGGPTYSLTLHGDLPVYGVDHQSKMRHATCITTDGPHLVTQIVEQVGVTPEKLMSNWMGVNTHVFTPGDRPPPDGRLRLLTVARLHRCKGHVHALQAVRTLLDAGVDVRYTLAGEGPHREQIIDDIRRLHLESRVDLLGTLGEQDVLAEMRRANVFVLPSVGVGEAGPISVMEAMSTGLPVVASIIGATPVMIRDGQTGLLTPQGDADAIGRALRSLIDDSSSMVRLGLAARAYAVDHFDSRSTAIRLLEKIEHSIGTRLRPA